MIAHKVRSKSKLPEGSSNVVVVVVVVTVSLLLHTFLAVIVDHVLTA